MPNPDFDAFKEALDDDFRSAGRTRIIQGIDGDKAKAATSLDMEKRTGDDAGRIYSDFDNYMGGRKSVVGQTLVESDDDLVKYAIDHPLNGVVSKDDWGALSAYSEAVDRYRKQGGPLGPFIADTADTVKQGLQGAIEDLHRFSAPVGEMTEKVKEAREGMTSYLSPELQKKLDEAVAKQTMHPEIGNLALEAYTVLGAPVISAISNFVSGPISNVTGWRKDLVDGAILVAMSLGGLKGIHAEMGVAEQAKTAKQLQKVLDIATRTIERSDPFTKAGEQPGIGTDPAITQLMAIDAKQRMKLFDAVMDMGNKTETKELSPDEAFARLNEIKLGDQEATIRFDGARALYGDELPEPGDKLLGGIPGVRQQFIDSMRSGQAIRIKEADLLKLDKDVYKILHDDIALQDGLTPKEAEAVSKVEPKISTIPESAFPPFAEEIRRPYTLRSTGGGNFNIRNEAGEKTGGIKVVENEGGKNLFISWEEGPMEISGFRTMMDQLKQRYPDAETITVPKYPGIDSIERHLQGSTIDVEMPFRIKETAEQVMERSMALQPLFDLPKAMPRAPGEPIVGEPLWYQGIPPEGVGKPQTSEYWTTNRDLAYDYAGKGGFIHVARHSDLPAGMIAKAQAGKTDSVIGGERQQVPTIATLPRDTPAEQFEALGKAPREPLVSPLEQVPSFEPGVLADKRKYEQYQREMNEQNQALAKRQFDKAARAIRKRDELEWKEREKTVREAVTNEINRRPDIKARALFQSGIYMGQDVHFLPKLDPKYLNDAQKASFPKRWQSKDGMDPDVLASQLGYPSGDTMIDSMIRLEQQIGDRAPIEAIRKLINDETNRRMEQLFGDRAEQTYQEAMDHTIGAGKANILHMEREELALRAGTPLPLSRDDVKAHAAMAVDGKKQTQVSYKAYMNDLYRAGKAAESAFLKGDYMKAFRQKDYQVHLFEQARLVREVERDRTQLSRSIDRFSKRYPEGVQPQYTEWIQHIIERLGERVDRRDLAEQILTRKFKTLREFVDDYNAPPEGWQEYETAHIPGLIVTDELMDPNNPIPKIKDMTVGQLRAINGSIQSLQHIGRTINQFKKGAEVFDLKETVDKAVDQMKLQGLKKLMPPGEQLGLIKQLQRGDITYETLFLKLDGWKPGFFTENFSIPLARAVGDHYKLWKEFHDKAIAIDKKYGPTTSKSIDNQTFLDPRGTGQFIPMTHEQVRAVALNKGNASNLEYLIEGNKVTGAQLDDFEAKHMTKNDIDWAVARGNLYKEIQAKADAMTMRMSGTKVEMLPLPDITTIDGPKSGYYYPIMYDRTVARGKRDILEKSPPRQVRTYRGWERKRTGPVGPLDLSINGMDSDINRRLHDIAWREVLNETNKVWSNPKFRDAMDTYVGRGYKELLDKVLHDISGQMGTPSGPLQAATQWGNWARRATMASIVGMRAGIFMKHIPTAAMRGWIESGVTKRETYQAAIDLFKSNDENMKSEWKFMMEGGKIGGEDVRGSSEMPTRVKNFSEHYGVEDWRLKAQNMREWLWDMQSRPFAYFDMIFSGLLWKSKRDQLYKKYLLEGDTPVDAHNKAVDLADFAVRRTHGVTSYLQRPELLRAQGVGRWLTPLLGFINNMSQSHYEMWSRAGAVKRGEDVAQNLSRITGLMVGSVIVPVAIAYFVDEAYLGKEDEDENLGWTGLKGFTHLMSGTVPVIGGMVNDVVHGRDPTAGLFTALPRHAISFAKQLAKEEPDVGKILQDLSVFTGVAIGAGSEQAGMFQRFLYNYMQGIEQPQDITDWYRGVRRGTIERRRR